MERRQIVVVTGASAGVGRATVRAFAKAGAWLGLIARGTDGLFAARDEVEALGGRALVLPCDVADAAAVEAAAERMERELGPIDVWVNDAMTSVFSPFLETTPEEFERVIQVSLLGYVHGTRAALRHMVPRNRGHVVQVSSALAFRSIPLQSAYCTAKHGIVGFTEAVRTELLHEGIDVHLTMVHLPAVDTPQFGWVKSRLPRRPQPVPPIFAPEVAARAIHRAAGMRRRDVTVGFSAWRAILADKFAPRLTDHLAARFGWEGQMTDEPDHHDRPFNLWKPVPGDHGASGSFTDRAARSSPFTWLNLRRGWFAGAAALLGLGRLALRRT